MLRLGIRIALLAAVVCVVAAGSASAETTAAVCKPVAGGAGFSDSHCVTSVGAGATFAHETTPVNTQAQISVTNAGMAATLRTNVSGVEVSVACNTASGIGFLENRFPGTIEMNVHVIFKKITFGGCTVENIPGCTVSGGTVETNVLIFSTLGLGMGIKVAPETGSELAWVTIDGCSATFLNGTWPVNGSVVLTPHGVTLTSEHNATTGQGTLSWLGHKAGLTSSLKFVTSNGSGIAFTT
jgi:hypothetical protein